MKNLRIIILASLAVLFAFTSCVKTEEEKKVEKVTLNETSLNLIIGDKIEFTVEISPEDALYDGLVWTSSNEEVATVTEGLVKAIAEGNVEITVTAGGVSAVCEVTVTAPAIPVESVTLNEESLDLLVGDQVELTVEILPEDAEYDEFVWSSSDEAVATVADGLVTAVAEGSAEITVQVGDVTDVCAVTVSVPAPPAIGDIFYSDGTWSTELDPDKTPIGLVFYVYDPTEDDAALARDFPECTHGLVFSLAEAANGVAWQENFNEYNALVSTWIEANLTDYSVIKSNGNDDYNLNSIMGYNNTKAIEAFNAANPDYPVTVVDIVKDFAESVPAPENTSGWYLPSVKELSLICTGYYSASIGMLTGKTEQMEELNGILEGIEGADILSGVYAGSTELELATLTFYELGLNMVPSSEDVAGGSVAWNLKTDLNNVVRPVLAF